MKEVTNWMRRAFGIQIWVSLAPKLIHFPLCGMIFLSSLLPSAGIIEVRKSLCKTENQAVELALNSEQPTP